MGRTTPTYRDRVQALRQRWRAFRRGLRRRDQAPFDRLFEHARQYADAGGHLNPTTVEPVVLLSMALGQQREIAQLRERLDALEEQLNAGDAAGGDRDGHATDG